ncbi:MAG: winged helix-turn-helix domain-containing protein [Candidatus Ancillula sp.]|jgi:DNA-binding response OmpR family regulator|nr:winged helix-turn-helix domain-containing protein [Candidatus Ancillula sp.]
MVKKKPIQDTKYKAVMLDSAEYSQSALLFMLKNTPYKVYNAKDLDEFNKFLDISIKNGLTIIAADLNQEEGDPQSKVKFAKKITINRKKMKVKVAGENIHLTPLEYRIFEQLYINHDTVMSKQEISDAIWGWSSEDSNSIVSHILNIRKKLGKSKDVLQNVRGFGYVLTENPGE